ncbi:hypothetical protein HMPREF1869_01069 [Bacteroidales bacterium KA00251]|nr:hypothetical protein HMPREF1869_01069 [Bacteroidales bacterium KA00251]
MWSDYLSLCGSNRMKKKREKVGKKLSSVLFADSTQLLSSWL